MLKVARGSQRAPSDERGVRAAGLCGVAFAVLMGVSLVIEGGRPDTYATDAEVARFFGNEGNQYRAALAAFLLAPVGVLFLWFLAGLYRRLRAADEDGQGSIAVVAGGVFFITFIVANKLIDNITGASLAFSPTYTIDPQEARLMSGLAYWVQGASMAGASVLLIGASMLGRRAGLLPAWATRSGYVLAAVAPASVALNGIPILLFFAWVIAVGVLLARRPAGLVQQRSEGGAVP